MIFFNKNTWLYFKDVKTTQYQSNDTPASSFLKYLTTFDSAFPIDKKQSSNKFSQHIMQYLLACVAFILPKKPRLLMRQMVYSKPCTRIYTYFVNKSLKSRSNAISWKIILRLHLSN